MTPTANEPCCDPLSVRGQAVPADVASVEDDAGENLILADSSIDPGNKTPQSFQPPHSRRKKPLVGRILIRTCQVLIVLGVFVALLVLSDVAVAGLVPSASTALHHALLTAQAAVLAMIACGLVYLAMNRQHTRLSNTAQRLTQLVDEYRKNPSNAGRFENPHLVTCEETLGDCPPHCPAPNCHQHRCWQVAPSPGARRTNNGSATSMERCYECEVYQQSCPDKLTKLGESFNNLMFLLEEEARQNTSMRAQMVEKEKLVSIGQIAAGVAHEVCNPLSSISSVVQMLKRKTSSEPTIEQLDIIETHIKRISNTVRQLVRMAPPGSERWEQCDVVKLLGDAVRLIRFDRRARGIDIQFDPSQKIPRVFVLANQLQQVFLNLGLNALDAMPQGGTLTIKATRLRQDLVVSIEDTGTGIPLELGDRIFEPFFTTKEAGKGTGLGLAVSYGIVQKHGGTLSFESRQGDCTVFTVTLPIQTEPPSGDHGTHDNIASR